MTIAFINLGASANPDLNIGTDLVGYSGTSWTPPSYGCIILFVDSRVVGNDTPVPAGNNIDWYLMRKKEQGDDSLSFFVGDPSNSETGIFGVNFSGSANAYCNASLFHISGSYMARGATGTVAQIKDGSGANGTSLTLNFDNATGTSGNSRPIAGFHHRANEATTPRTNWVEADDLAGAGTNRDLETQWRQSAFEGTASASWASTAINIGICAEILDADDYPIYEEAVSISKGVALTFVEATVVAITKGFVAAVDFLSGLVTPTSFKANDLSATDSASSVEAEDE